MKIFQKNMAIYCRKKIEKDGFNRIMTVYVKLRNWFIAWAGAFSVFFTAWPEKNMDQKKPRIKHFSRCIFGHMHWRELRKISIVTITHSLQLILIWKWNINETYLFIMKFIVPWSLLPESVAQFFTPFYQFFMKIKIRNVSWQSMSNFLSAILKKLPVNI